MKQQQILQTLQEHGLVEWRYVRNDRLTQTAGRCKYFQKTIELAGWLLDHNTEEEIMQTLVHEIAHALTKGHGHDRVWAAKCRELGGTGEAYYNRGNRNVNNPNTERRYSSKTYSVYCQGCGYDFPFYTRKRKSNNLTHTGCGGKVVCLERM